MGNNKKDMSGSNNPMYGRHQTKEQREKHSAFMKRYYLENRHPMIGRKQSLESRKKMSEIKKRLFNSGKINNLGRHHSEETRLKIGKNHKYPRGINHPLFGKHHSNEAINKIKEVRAKQILPLKDTSIELKIQSYLKRLGIEFYTHQYIKEIEHGYQCDILIPIQEGISKKTIIECFGSYWHNYPYSRQIDIDRCNELREQGYRVLVFWENEIKVMQLNDLENKLITNNKRLYGI